MGRRDLPIKGGFDTTMHTDFFSYYSPFESQEVLRRWLLQSYQLRPAFKEEAYTWSYQNTSVFHYEWLIGRNYWMEGINSSLLIKPLLLFYGLTHLLKGLVLIEDPRYPASVEVLAHGVTARKRKKKGYTFLEDEIKIQKRGFFPHFSNYLFHVEHLPGEKWKMNELLLLIDGMASLYFKVRGTEDLYKVYIEDSFFTIQTSKQIQREDAELFSKALENINISTDHVTNISDSSITFKVKSITNDQKSLLLKHNNQLYLPPSFPSKYCCLPELCLHYLLLYNLSMICRYEGEWWGEVISQQFSEDFPMIKTYLTIAGEKVPSLFQSFFV